MPREGLDLEAPRCVLVCGCMTCRGGWTRCMLCTLLVSLCTRQVEAYDESWYSRTGTASVSLGHGPTFEGPGSTGSDLELNLISTPLPPPHPPPCLPSLTSYNLRSSPSTLASISLVRISSCSPPRCSYEHSVRSTHRAVRPYNRFQNITGVCSNDRCRYPDTTLLSTYLVVKHTLSCLSLWL